MSVPDWALGIDLEDPHGDSGGDPRLSDLTQALLDFFAERGAAATFFVVGDVARRHPDLVRRIAAAGHEIACHSDRHLRLGSLGPRAFADDTRRALDSLAAAGADRVRGYRAPCFSLSEATAWAYEVLAEHGFTYSSSVLPARNPMGGWPRFGPAPRSIAGVLEIPVTLHPMLRLPLGGVYFRALPWLLLEPAFRGRVRMVSYLHPYDLDDRRAHPGFARWSPYGLLMRLGRDKMLSRLARAAEGYQLVRYDRLAAALSGAKDQQQWQTTTATT